MTNENNVIASGNSDQDVSAEEQQFTEVSDLISGYNAKMSYVTEINSISEEMAAFQPVINNIEAARSKIAELEEQLLDPEADRTTKDNELLEQSSELDNLNEQMTGYDSLQSRLDEAKTSLAESDKTLLDYVRNIDVSGMSENLVNFRTDYLKLQDMNSEMDGLTREFNETELPSPDLDKVREAALLASYINPDKSSEVEKKLKSVEEAHAEYDARKTQLEKLTEERDSLSSGLNTRLQEIKLSGTLNTAVTNDSKAELYLAGYLFGKQFGDEVTVSQLVEENHNQLIENYNQLMENERAMALTPEALRSSIDVVSTEVGTLSTEVSNLSGGVETQVNKAVEAASQEKETEHQSFRDYVKKSFRKAVLVGVAAGTIFLGTVFGGGAYVNHELNSASNHQHPAVTYQLDDADAARVADLITVPGAEPYKLSNADASKIAGMVEVDPADPYLLTDADAARVADLITVPGAEPYKLSNADASKIAGMVEVDPADPYLLTDADAARVADLITVPGAEPYLLTDADAARVADLITVPGAEPYVLTDADARRVAGMVEVDPAEPYVLTDADARRVAGMVEVDPAEPYVLTDADARRVAGMVEVDPAEPYKLTADDKASIAAIVNSDSAAESTGQIKLPDVYTVDRAVLDYVINKDLDGFIQATGLNEDIVSTLFDGIYNVSGNTELESITVNLTNDTLQAKVRSGDKLYQHVFKQISGQPFDSYIRETATRDQIDRLQ